MIRYANHRANTATKPADVTKFKQQIDQLTQNLDVNIGFIKWDESLEK